MSTEKHEVDAEQSTAAPNAATRSLESDDKHTVVVPQEKEQADLEAKGPLGDLEVAEYPTGAKLALITLGLCLATFVVSPSLAVSQNVQ